MATAQQCEVRGLIREEHLPENPRQREFQTPEKPPKSQ